MVTSNPPRSTAEKSSVFISYSRADREYVEPLVAHLEQQAVECVYDTRDANRGSWPTRLRQQIEASVAVVVVQSPRSEASDWVRSEILHARNINKPILPLLLEGEQFFLLAHLDSEVVERSRMPSSDWILRLQTLMSARTRPVVDEVREQLQAHIGRQDWDRVLDCANSILEASPNDFAAYDNKGWALTRLGRYEEAVEVRCKALDLNPGDAICAGNIAQNLLNLDRPEEALRYADAAIASRSRYAIGHSLRSLALERVGRRQESLRSMKIALELAPNEVDVHVNAANLLLKLDQLDDGLAAADAAIDIDPDSLPAHNARGIVLLSLRLRVSASASFKRALRIDPTNRQARDNLELALKPPASRSA